LLHRPEYLRFVVVSVAAMTTFYGFVSGAPHLLIGDGGAGLTATQYGVYYTIVPLGFLTGSMLAGRLGVRLGNNRLCAIGSSLGVLGCTIGLVMVWALGAHPLAIVLPMALCAAGAGLGMAGSQAGMVSSSPDQPGVASGLAAFSQLALSAVMVQIIGMIVGYGPIAVSAAMVVSSSIGLIGYAWWTRSANRQSGCAVAT
jgi:DHA1 family bicyclomycin/chloramphenicol resistance-like MFS transporter